MRLLAHISDLHFGTEQAPIAAGLIEDLHAVKPHLVVVSGDLTQRARAAQFRAARDYLKLLPAPQLIVPGNHDVPLYDVTRRFLAPLSRYRKLITPDLAPWFEDDEMAVLGINTARSFTWKSGRISHEQIKGMRGRLENVGRTKFKVVVTHHPFIPPPGEEGASVDLVGRAGVALRVIDHHCVDLLLAGHLHLGYTGDIRAYYPATKRSIVVAQAGTAISRRVRHEPNAYNLISLDGETLRIEVRVWEQQRFHRSSVIEYGLHKDEWQLHVAQLGDAPIGDPRVTT